MTTMHLPPQTAVTALRGAFARRGLELLCSTYPEGRMYGAEIPPDLTVLVFDYGGRYITGPPTAWSVEAWRDITAAAPHLLGETQFPVDAVDGVAAWAAAFLPQTPNVPAPQLTPPPAARPPARHAAAPRQRRSVLPRAATTEVHPGVKARTVRPGRYPFEAWPPQLNIQVCGPRRTERGRLWQAWAAQQPLGVVLAESVPRPPGRIRRVRTRVVWRAYFHTDPGLTADLTGRGRESLRGALHVLAQHWQATHRSLGA